MAGPRFRRNQKRGKHRGVFKARCGSLARIFKFFIPSTGARGSPFGRTSADSLSWKKTSTSKNLRPAP
jgi:hypothetical protein